MGRLDGKTAFITGAGGAIAGAIARRFATEGAAVMCVDVNADSVARTAGSISSAGGRAIARRCDVKATDVKAAIDAAVEAFSRTPTAMGRRRAAAPPPGDRALRIARFAQARGRCASIAGVSAVTTRSRPCSSSAVNPFANIRAECLKRREGRAISPSSHQEGGRWAQHQGSVAAVMIGVGLAASLLVSAGGGLLYCLAPRLPYIGATAPHKGNDDEPYFHH